jgi:hypothetical protein
VVPVFNYFQAALVLLEDKQLESGQVARVAVEMADRFGYTVDTLRNSLQDLLRRGRVRRSSAFMFAEHVLQEGAERLGARPSAHELLAEFARRVQSTADIPQSIQVPVDGAIDYLAALEADLPRRKRRS